MVSGLFTDRLWYRLVAKLQSLMSIGNERVPKSIINNAYFFLKQQSAFWTVTVSECCLKKIASYILFEKCINILALEMPSRENHHCANCIGALSFPVPFSTRSSDNLSVFCVRL